MDFQEKFVEEARELVYGLESRLISLESNPGDKVAVDEVFRVMHTLKGTASMFGFESIEQITHQLETIYDLIRDDKQRITDEIVNVTFSAIDIIKIILDKTNNLDSEEQSLFNEVLNKINKLGVADETINKTQVKKEAKKEDQEIKQRGYYILYKPDEDIYFRGIKPLGIFFDLNDIGKYKAFPFLDKVPDPEDFNPDKFFIYWDIFFLSNYPPQEIKDIFLFFGEEEYFVYELNPDHPDEKEFFAKYTKLTGKKLNPAQVEDVFETLKNIDNIASHRQEYIGRKDEKTEKETTLKDIVKKTEDIVKKSSTIRVSADKLDYLITNVSEFVTLYSQISLFTKSIENKELNKSIQALGKLSKKLRDNALELRLVPINELSLKLHRLIRDLSRKLNKEVSFITEGTDTELDKTIIDNLEDPLMHIIRNSLDHGIEDKETRQKIDKPDSGIIRLTAFYSGAYVFIQIQDDGRGIDLDIIWQKAVEKGFISGNAQLTKRELYDLLFLPGFTTAENVSKISGRGVGMDVVKQKINELRGEIEIDSEINLGTSVTIKLPLTLSIIDTLKVRIEDLVYLLPLAVVETCIGVKYHQLVNSTKKQYEYENTLLPVIILRDEFNLKNDLPENGKIVIIKQYEKKYCLLVDQVLGDHQAVIKPLGDLHKKHEYFSGVSVMGDGSLALILDTGKLLTINKLVHHLN